MNEIEYTVFLMLTDKKQCSKDSSLKITNINDQAFDFLITCSNNQIYQDFLNVICFFDICKSLFIEKGYGLNEFKVRKLKNNFALYFYKDSLKEFSFIIDIYAKAYLFFKKEN